MIEVKTGDMLSVTEGIIVHGCNCQGAMGGGIARLIRAKWPDVFAVYDYQFKQVGLHLGDVVLLGGSDFMTNPDINQSLNGTSHQLPPGLIVANAMTQYNYGGDKSIVYVDYDGVFAAFARIKMIARLGLTVNFPLIGCGLANGQWDEVAQAIERAMGPDIKLVLWKLPA